MENEKPDNHKTFLERGAESKEDREFDEFVAEERKKNEGNDDGVETISNEGDGTEPPEQLRVKPEEKSEEKKDSSGEESEEGKEPKNPHWDKLAKLQESKKEKKSGGEEYRALEAKVDRLTELLEKNQNSQTDSGGDVPKFTFREMEEGEDAAEYQKERDEALTKFAKEQAGKKRDSKPPQQEQPKNENAPGLTNEDKEELQLLESSFKDKDDFLDTLETNRITTGMLRHLNETTDPEAVTKAIANDGKLARRIQRLETSRERRLAIMAVEHDIANGNLKEPPKDKGNRGIPETRPAATKGKKDADEGSLASEFGNISEHGINHDNKIVRF